MPETPITTIGLIRSRLGEFVFELSLPNGKVIPGHVPKRLNRIIAEIDEGDHVRLEMTPYDFEKARIVGRANADHE